MKGFPFLPQLDAMDCGPSCLRMVASFYGRNYSLQYLRELCHITREGVSLLGVSDAAESIGFRTTGVKVTWEQLRDEMPMPCIVHWNQRHFVVVYGLVKRRKGIFLKIADPASGLLEYRVEIFLKSWLQTEGKNEGIALILEPTPVFYQEEGEENRRYGFGYVFQYLKPYRPYIIQILLAMLTASIISLFLPFITQAIVDTGIGSGDTAFIIMMLIGQLFLVLGYMANNLIRRWLMLHTTSRVSISLISDFLCKLMKLPISFFDSKKVGDIIQRIGDHNRIQSFLTGSLLSIVIATVSLLIYSIIMAGYNAVIFLVFLLGSILYVSWVLLFMKRRKKLDYMRFQQASANQNTIIQLIGGMQDIKLNNCEKQKRWGWERVQAKLFKVSVKSLSLGQAQEVGSTFINQSKDILITFIAAKSVITGDMTLGMMMALQYIMGQLNAPIAQFISFAQSAQDASISLERLGEINEMQDEEPKDSNRIQEIPINADIVLKDVVYQYEGPHSTTVLNGITLTIPAGKVTAIVGASGSGKTTLIKMMLGFYEPISGSLSIGSSPLKSYNVDKWRAHCGSVMQEGYIFTDTISANIALTDEMPDLDRVKKAAILSNINEWIESLPLGYNTIIGADGHGLSSGQKQRILLARATYKNADYLFLDEATNALDANNERSIMDNLEHYFKQKTVVIVAHRLSTVKNADNIIVLNDGKIVEQGSHQELTNLQGEYYKLVKNQLELGK